MSNVQYRITDRGRDLLESGDYLMELAAEAAKDGVVSSKELMELHLELTQIEADRVISVLHRASLIEPAPIQGVSTERFVFGGG